MDQTTSQNQKLLRYICERSKITDMDCRLSLCACGDFEKESIYQLITERDSTGDVAPVSKQLKLYHE